MAKIHRTCKGCGKVQLVRPQSASRQCGKCAAKEVQRRPEIKAKNSAWHTGRPSGMRGRQHTESAKEKNRAANLGRRSSVATEFKKGQTPANRKPIDDSLLAAMYAGGLPSTEISRQIGLSKPCVLKRLKRLGVEIRNSVEMLRQQSLNRPPEQHPRWKGGATPEAVRIRQSQPYAEWRTAVFQRDNYTCVFCGNRGGKLHGDHIKPFSLFPELRFDVSNGRALCVPCHKATPTYLRSNLKREDFE